MKVWRKKERGFTLIEVMVAMLIFGLSISALILSGTQSTAAISRTQTLTLASTVADNELARFRRDAQDDRARSGEVTQMGQVFRYSLVPETTEVAGFLEIQVTIRNADDETLLVRRGFAAQKGGS